jgi:hypothetical protein
MSDLQGPARRGGRGLADADLPDLPGPGPAARPGLPAASLVAAMTAALWLLLLGVRIALWPLARFGLLRGVAVWTAVLVVAVRVHGS